MGCKSVETTRNISNIFGPGIANKHTVQWWFKKFSQGNESLVDEEFSGHQSEIDNDQLRVLLKLILLQLQAAAAAKSLQSCLTLCDPMMAAHQAPQSLGFSRQEHWRGLPFPSSIQLQENLPKNSMLTIL